MSGVEDDPREQAIGWTIRLRDAPTAHDWEAFTLWLERDPANNAAYEHVAQADRLADDGIASKVSPSAAATAIPAAANDPEPFSLARRRRGIAIAAVALAAGITGVAVLVPREQPTLFETQPGEHRQIALADGSRIDLNGDTRLTLKRDGRGAELARGEATFSIRHDPGRVFQLVAGSTIIRDVGTTFDVIRTDGSTQIAVGSGRVMVNPNSDRVEIGAGQALLAADGAARVEKRSVSADDVGTWRTGHLVFRDAPLTLVADQVTRTTGQPIAVDHDLEGRSFTGLLIVSGDRPGLARKLGPLLGIDIVQNADGWHWRAGARSAN